MQKDHDIKVREYVANDYMVIHRRHFDSLTFLSFPDPEKIAKNLSTGPAYTITNGVPIACGGILPLWEGVGEGWVVTSSLVEKYPIIFAKTVWRSTLELIESMDLDRIQTVVDAEHTVSQIWVERMGFKNEGLMRKYLGGRDFIRYALIRER
ncbi:unnamed protein product [marine sediment metagenome]|uniref:N-acetyltransferase domain-containing protein n=1 Tax=marine sediment metagenome TaxID=412755 RepID=X0SUK5_9ZZZZ